MNKLIVYTVSSIIGGITGYLIGEVIAEKVYEKKLKELEELGKSSPEFKKKLKEIIDDSTEVIKARPPKKPIDYSKKERLEDITAKYKSEAVISIVTEEEYSNGKPGYANEVLMYYVDDGTYANEQEEIVIAQDILGPNAHLHFGEESGDPDIVYIRNDKRAMYYELVKMHTSYAVAVLGEPVADPKPKPKRVRKKKNEETED